VLASWPAAVAVTSCDQLEWDWWECRTSSSDQLRSARVRLMRM